MSIKIIAENRMDFRNASIISKLEEAIYLFDYTGICGKEKGRAERLLAKLKQGSMTISVIGQFKRGKSMLINSLLEESLLPVGIIPVTSAVTHIKYGKESTSVKFANGAVRRIETGEVSRYISEKENPGNHLGVVSVTLHSDSDFLSGGFTLVDTPGVGSVHRHNSRAAYEFIKESDAVIFLLSVDTPMNEIEVELLKNAGSLSGKFYFAVNKIDIVDSEELAEYVRYCRDLIGELTGEEDISIFPVSAKTGEGVASLKEAITADAASKLRSILENSASKKLKDITICALSQIELYWKALIMPVAVLGDSLRRAEESISETKKAGWEFAEELDSCDMHPANLETLLGIRENELKQALSQSVSDIFGMDYHYDIIELDEEGDIESISNVDKGPSELISDFKKRIEELCANLEAKLRKVLLYREDSTVEVVVRIYGLNRVTRQLRRLRDSL